MYHLCCVHEKLKILLQQSLNKDEGKAKDKIIVYIILELFFYYNLLLKI